MRSIDMVGHESSKNILKTKMYCFENVYTCSVCGN